MAIYYVRSTDGSDSDNGSTWALAKATLAGALAVAAAGDTVYVSDNHSGSSTTGQTLASAGTADNPVRIICVDDSAEPPTAVATTATITNGTAGIIALNGYAYCYGITFIQNANADISVDSTGSNGGWVCEECAFQQNGASSGQDILIGDNVPLVSSFLHLNNCDITFNGHANNQILIRTTMIWRGGSLLSTTSTTQFAPTAVTNPMLYVAGVDLSAIGSGKNIVDVGVASGFKPEFHNCKLGSSATLTTGTIINLGSARARFVNCDSADTNYRYYFKCYEGESFHEATIVRAGGASDGTTPISRKMVSSAGSTFSVPLVSDPIIKWNETTGSSVTATVEIVTDNVTLTDAEAWIEVEYLGTSGFPLSLFASDRATNILSTPANQATSSVTWTTTGLTTPVKQKLSVSFTPQEKGPIQVRVHLAKASTTLYFCPEVDIT